MKKLFIAAVMAVAAMGMTSCGNSTPKPNLKTDVDTLSYAMGLSQTQGLKEYLVQMDIDTTYIDAFVKGLNEGANAGDDKKKAAYFAGVNIGQQISNRMVKGINHEIFGEDSTKTISLKNFMAGFITGVTGKKGLMTIEQAGQTAHDVGQREGRPPADGNGHGDPQIIADKHQSSHHAQHGQLVYISFFLIHGNTSYV